MTALPTKPPVFTWTERYSKSYTDALKAFVSGLNDIPDPQYDPQRIVPWLVQVEHCRKILHQCHRGRYFHQHKGRKARQGLPVNVSIDAVSKKWCIDYLNHVTALLARIDSRAEPRDVTLYEFFGPFCLSYRGPVKRSSLLAEWRDPVTRVYRRSI